MISLNNLGQQVIATNSVFYAILEGNDSFLCCGEYQDTVYCFANNTKQGCSYCEYDPYDECQCDKCQP